MRPARAQVIEDHSHNVAIRLCRAAAVTDRTSGIARRALRDDRARQRSPVRAEQEAEAEAEAMAEARAEAFAEAEATGEGEEE